MAGGQRAAAVLLAEGEAGGGDATDGAAFGSGAAAEASRQDRGDHIINLGIQTGAGGLDTDRLRANGMLIFRQAASPASSATVGSMVAAAPSAIRSKPAAAPHTPAPALGRRNTDPATGADHHHLPVAERAALQQRRTENIGPAEKGDMAAAQQRWRISSL